jgi:tetratricopeptide (TPR) repeat protein
VNLNSTNEGKSGTRFACARVFPNDPKIRFENRIHEQVVPSIRRAGLEEIKLPLEVLHIGYEDPDLMKEKQKRNLEHFREQFPDEKGMSPLNMYQYGASHKTVGDLENALKWLRESVKEARKQGYNDVLILAPYDIANILEQQGDLQGALESINISIKEGPQFDPATLRKAQILDKMGQKEEAAKWFGYAASHIPKISSLPSTSMDTHINSLKPLAEYWNKTMQTQVAIDILKTLKNLMLGTPHNPLALAEIYISHDKAAEAFDNLEFLKKELGEKPEFIFLYAQALALTGNLPEATKLISKAKEKFPQNEDIASLAAVFAP